MVYVPPISRAEFVQYLQKCMPPRGWPERLVVANSGGPDSTCLLYLLSSLVKEKRRSPGLPRTILSVHVNHKLQDAAREMADIAESNAGRFGVQHVSTEIHWGVRPFMQRPPSRTLERDARRARMRVLHDTMISMKSSCVAFAQHADDQVETSILRLANGSSSFGASGMRHIRRLGMGGLSEVEHFGQTGLNFFAIRPLLEISKDRIYATCKANNLRYATDPTNFQPHVTLRNRLRQILSQPETFNVMNKSTPEQSQPVDPEVPSDWPQGLMWADPEDQERLLRGTIVKLASQADIGHDGRPNLYSAVSKMNAHVRMVETKTTNLITAMALPSPPSTLFFSVDDLRKIEEHELRISFVRRILRYVSPYPWGHPSAEAHGNRLALNDIAQKIWCNEKETSPRGFSPGSGVLAWPVVIRPDGQVRSREPEPEDRRAWFFQRQPAFSVERLRRLGKSNPLFIDITANLQSLRWKGQPSLDVIYDNRFLVRIRVADLPKNLLPSLDDPGLKGTVVLEPDTKYFLPQLLWRRVGSKDHSLAKVVLDSKRGGNNFMVGPAALKVNVPWVRISQIRPIDDI
ncbi:hypothetical protein K474DRAFT_1664426 [Panus rudis PR-1116 ss-1]|nr:hypothetical protein K474DRAFT_1664426 [Panus rudis PR-1116 ss-1]